MKNWTRWSRDLSGATLLLLAGTWTTGCASEVSFEKSSNETDEEHESEGGSGSNGAIDGMDPARVDPPPAPTNDTCATPTLITASAGETAQASGTLVSAIDDESTWCADPQDAETGLRDVVYEVQLATECSTVFTLTGGSEFQGALSLRTEACTIDEYCVPVAETNTLHVSLPAGTYYAVVSGGGAFENTFDLTVECNTPTCGDGLLGSTEQCDDGNIVNGDGCDASCAFEAAAPELDTCEGATLGEAIEIGSTEILHVPGTAQMATTVGANDSGTGTCMLQPDGWFVAAPDHVRRVRPTVDGTLKLTVGLGFDDEPLCGVEEPSTFPYPVGCYDRALHVRTSCEAEAVSTEVGCSDDAESWWKPEEITMQVTAGTDYFVFVDGYHDDEYGAGAYVLRLEMLP